MRYFLLLQKWVRAFRDASFHDCININNGTEALNKALKHTYLPQSQWSTKISKLVTPLVETFLPPLRHKYSFTNIEQCNANRRYMYKDEIPKYLHNKPKAVILHYLNRSQSIQCLFL